MSYSNTIGSTVFSTRKVTETAARRCRMPPSTLTAEHWEIAKNELWLLLMSLPLNGDQLWTRERILVPIYENQNHVTLPTGTYDIANANFRYLTEPEGTATESSTIYSIQYDEATTITTFGIKWAAAAVPIAIEYSDDGVDWTTSATYSPDEASGEWSWYDVDPVASAVYFRVRVTSGAMSYDRVFFGNNPVSIPMGPINADDWSNLPNRTFTGQRITQYWFDRQVPSPVLRLWPMPDATAELGQLELWRRRSIMDVGTMTQEIEAPLWWYDAIVAGLAARFGRSCEEVNPDLISGLDADAERQLLRAQYGESDGAPSRLVPNISAYTR